MAKDLEPEVSKPPRHIAYYRQAKDLAMGVHPYSKHASILLLFFDALLTSLIITYVPCTYHLWPFLVTANLGFVDTEIDWTAYMEQVKQFIDGERDYTHIKGGTGPLVYPAAHVYIYWVLYHITDKGRNILNAQRIFAVLYLGTLAVVMACYRRAKVFHFLSTGSKRMIWG